MTNALTRTTAMAKAIATPRSQTMMRITKIHLIITTINAATRPTQTA